MVIFHSRICYKNEIMAVQFPGLAESDLWKKVLYYPLCAFSLIKNKGELEAHLLRVKEEERRGNAQNSHMEQLTGGSKGTSATNGVERGLT